MWPEIERLFGLRGACGGCWCMFWRAEKGEKWDDMKGEMNKERFRKLIRSGQAHGILAFADGEPIGWCSFDRRTDYARLDRSPSLACADADRVWSIPCFFIQRGYRRQGVAGLLLKRAIAALKKRRAKIVEGYPVRPSPDGKPTAAAFTYTGTRPMFLEAGFKVVGNRDGGKQRVRKAL